MVKNIERPETLPHSIDAERNVLAGIIIEPDQLPALRLKPSDFYHPWHRDIFKCMVALQRASLPLTWVRMHQELLGQAGQGDDAPTISYLSDIFNDGTTVAYLPDDASIVREKSRKRAFLQRVPLLIERSQNGTRTDALEEQWTEAVELLKEDKPEAVAELFTSVGDLLDTEEDKPIAWAIYEMVPRSSLTIVAAEPGAGKSTWLRNLTVCVAQGRPFQGREVKQGPVLLFSLEESKAMVAEHMRKMGATHEDPIHIRFDPLLGDAVTQLRVAIERIKPALVVIDPVAKFINLDDLNSYGQVSPAMDEIVQLAHDGTTILLVTHVNKAGEDKRPGGSVAFSAAADIILHLAVEGPERRRVLTGVKNRFDERYLLQPTVIKLDHETGHMMEDGSRDEAIYDDLSSNILAWLAGHDGTGKQKELLAAMGGKSSISHRALTRLVDVGKVQIDRTKKPYVCSIPATVPMVPDSSRDSGTMENQLELPTVPWIPPVGGPGTREQGNERHDYNSTVPGSWEREPGTELEPMTSDSIVEERADALLNDVETDAKIQAPWWQTMPEWEIAPIDRTDPPVDGTATFHATRLTALLDERLTEKYATSEERAILDQNRMPYDSVVNGVGVMRQWAALQGCGVIALLFQPDEGRRN